MKLSSSHAVLYAVLLMACMSASSLLKYFRVRVLAESGAFILVGFLAGLIISASTLASELSFSADLVYFILLPFIIFDAGFSLARGRFFRNLAPIALLALVGTIANNLLFGGALCLFGAMGADVAVRGFGEAMLFGAVVSATDPVATLAVMGAPEVNANPLLYTLILGESVLNDAVALTLYDTFREEVPYDEDGRRLRADPIMLSGDLPEAVRSVVQAVSSTVPREASVRAGPIIGALFFSMLVAVGSALFGACVGMLASFTLRRLRTKMDADQAKLAASTPANAFPSSDSPADADASLGTIAPLSSPSASPRPPRQLTLSTPSELMLLVSFAALAYVLSDALGLSGVMSLFFSGIAMAQSAFWSLSLEAQLLSVRGAKTMALLSETLLFAYLGLSAGIGVGSSANTPESNTLEFRPALVVLTLLLCVLARAAHVLPLMRLANYFRSSTSRCAEDAGPIPGNMQAVLVASGLRGPISFMLSFSFPGPAGPAVRAATLTLVLLCVLVGGATTEPLLRKTGMYGGGSTAGSNRAETEGEKKGQQVSDEEKQLDSRLHAQVDPSPTPGGTGATLYGAVVKSDSFSERVSLRLRAWWFRPGTGGLAQAHHWVGWAPSSSRSAQSAVRRMSISTTGPRDALDDDDLTLAAPPQARIPSPSWQHEPVHPHALTAVSEEMEDQLTTGGGGNTAFANISSPSRSSTATASGSSAGSASLGGDDHGPGLSPRATRALRMLESPGARVLRSNEEAEEWFHRSGGSSGHGNSGNNGAASPADGAAEGDVLLGVGEALRHEMGGSAPWAAELALAANTH